MERRQYLRTVGGGITTALTVPVAGCLGDDSYDIGMRASIYAPEEFTTSVGEEVVWKNPSTRTHTVTAHEGTMPAGAEYFASGGFTDQATAYDAWWDSRGGALDSGDTFTHTFTVPGTYSYACVPHETAGMVGTIIVEK
ncbi:MAG: plastocyanin [Halorubrum sp. J07HR59]|nr:MAG: plastocyanin [Halorubrum sp. J07HR59]